MISSQQLKISIILSVIVLGKHKIMLRLSCLEWVIKIKIAMLVLEYHIFITHILTPNNLTVGNIIELIMHYSVLLMNILQGKWAYIYNETSVATKAAFTEISFLVDMYTIVSCFIKSVQLSNFHHFLNYNNTQSWWTIEVGHSETKNRVFEHFRQNLNF